MKKKPISLAPSSAKIWLNCPGSLKLKKSRNQLEERPEAARGILIHKIAAQLLLGQALDLTIAEYQAYKESKDVIDDAVRFYLDYVPRKGKVEEFFRIVVGAFLLQGAPDCYTIEDNVVTVYDLKTGFVEIPAEQNLQLITYGHMIAQKYKIKTPVLRGVIVQPMLKQTSYAKYFFDKDFFKRLKTLNLKRFVVGPHCEDCQVKQVCKKFIDTVKFYLAPEYRDYTYKRTEVWDELLGIAKPAEKFFVKVRSEGFQYLQAGGKIEGWQIVQQNGRRTWNQGLDAKKLAKATGLKATDCESVSLISPAQAEEKLKQLGKSAEKMNGLFYIPLVNSLRAEKKGF